MYTYSVGAKAEIIAILKPGKGADSNGGGGFGKGFDGGFGKGFDGGFGKGVDRKEVAVWKLPDEVSKVRFRHWLNALDSQLEAVHGWRHADIVLNRVKRSEDPIDADSLERCLTEAEDEIDKLEGDNFDPHVKHNYPFSERSKFLYAYMINKLNTFLHDRIISIEGKNGFEVYRQVA